MICKYNILVLAYGVSEGTVPVVTWNLDTNVETINSYFKKRNIIPDRYGDSYVYAVYDTTKPLNYTLIEEDLKRIIAQYKNIITSDKNSLIALSGQSKKYGEKDFEPESFMNDLNSTGLVFSSEFVSRFILSLLTKPFVILSGLAGSGKTQLAMMFAKWICEDIDKQVCMIPVGADWTNREFLIGYPNALEKGAYVKPDNGALDLIIEANKNPRKPYFLILDEMNLSYVERYFSDFLSVMESEEGIPLMKNCIDKEITPVIKLPRNLFIIGTINVDETTYMFSPKVLDRANTIEFSYVDLMPVINVDNESYSALNLDNSFLKTEYLLLNECFDSFDDIQLYCAELQSINKILQQANAHIGYRVRDELIFYLVNNKKYGLLAENEAFDNGLMQKILPRIQGSSAAVKSMLSDLFKHCAGDFSGYSEQSDNLSNRMHAVLKESGRSIKYRKSAEKIELMTRRLEEDGFTSYWL